MKTLTKASMQNEPLLNIKNLSTAFYTKGHWNNVIEDVNLKVYSGEIIAIVGESGSGKSVTSLSITGLLPKENSKITTGAIDFENLDLSKLSEAKIRALRGRKIAMIFQEPMTCLNPVETCGKQVLEMIRLHSGKSKEESIEKVLALFEKVRLPEPQLIFEKYPFEISGGQKQRVMIAMAMACGPKILIADEPTTALDPSVRKSILDLIQTLQKENGMGVIFITHDLESLRGFADTILVMHRGRVIESGSAKTILESPKEKYTQALMACKPPRDKKPYRLPTVEEIMKGSYVFKKAPVKKFSKSILEIQDLSYWYPIKKGFPLKTVDHIKAVNGVSFDLKRGESMGLIGESGCGKSTLGRVLAGLLIEHNGELVFEGVKRSSFDRKAWFNFRRKVQIIFQDPFSALNPKMTVGNAISEPLIAHGIQTRAIAKKMSIEMLERVGLVPQHYDRYPHEFSGGQRQRIGIARSLILEPEIIVCDESVSALDVSVQAQILNLLNDLKDDLGLTYFFISHDMDVVRYFCDRIMHMENGKTSFIENDY